MVENRGVDTVGSTIDVLRWSNWILFGAQPVSEHMVVSPSSRMLLYQHHFLNFHEVCVLKFISPRFPKQIIRKKSRCQMLIEETVDSFIQSGSTLRCLKSQFIVIYAHWMAGWMDGLNPYSQPNVVWSTTILLDPVKLDSMLQKYNAWTPYRPFRQQMGSKCCTNCNFSLQNSL